MPKKFGSRLSKFGNSLKDKAESVLEKIDDKIDLPIIIDFVGLKTAGKECFTKASETSGLCKITIEKAHEMVSFGKELHATLDDVVGGSDGTRSAGGGLDASKFAIIQDLVAGDRIMEAIQLAKDLSELSLECVDKSKEMMGAMEKGIDALPDVIEPFVENKLAKASTKGHKKGDPELPDIEGSIREMSGLVEDVENVNLFTLVDKGSAAFDGLQRNGEISKDMFSSIQTFAEDVASVSGSFQDFKAEDFRSFKSLGKIRQAAKSAWRCLRLSGLIKTFAEQVGKLIQWIISLFKIASQKLGSIWGALANAKEILAVCLAGVNESLRLCDESKEKSRLLMSTSGEVRDHLLNIMKIGKTGPTRAMKSLVNLADGDEILLCIDLGTNIDDMFAECIQQVIGTIDRVDRAISDMPEVLKEGVPKMVPVEDGDGNSNDDIEFEDYDYQTGQVPRGIDGDDDDSSPRITLSRASAAKTRKLIVHENVRALEDMTKSIESSSPLTVIQRSAEGFEGVHEAVGKCSDLIMGSRSHAQACFSAIDSFNNGEWNLNHATKHILEIFAIRDAGMAMKVLAESILELVKANVALMKTVRSRTKGLVAGGEDSELGLGSLMSSLASDVDLDDLKDLGNGIKKFGAFFRN